MKKIAAVILPLALFGFSQAYAGGVDVNTGSPIVTGMNGFYAGASVGMKPFNFDFDGHVAYRGTIGYQFSKNFAVESRYTGTPGDLSVVAKAMLPVYQGFGLFALGGVSHLGTIHGTYGLGGYYAFSPAWVANLGWDNVSSGATASYTSIGLSYHFGTLG